jgi:hypothetical protein
MGEKVLARVQHRITADSSRDVMITQKNNRMTITTEETRQICLGRKQNCITEKLHMIQIFA